MELDTALQGMLDAESKLRSAQAIGSPVVLSEQMMRLSAYTSAVEEKLAEYEKEMETSYAIKLKEYLITQGLKVTESERLVDIEIAETKGQVKYLTRLVGSAWKIVGVVQSRVNHLTREATTQI